MSLHQPTHGTTLAVPRSLFCFLYELSLDQNRDLLGRYRNGDRRSVVFYEAAIRLIYVHGHLTEDPDKYEAQDLIAICGDLTTFIRNLIRSDFQRRLANARNG